MKTLTAVLFAGGQSRRMGRDKAMLEINGEPLWLRQLRTLRELQSKKILISARKKPVWAPPEIETVLDDSPSQGPLSGLIAALKRIQTTHLFALAIDMPQMSSAQVEKLWSLADAGIGVVPQSENFIEPLSAVYPMESVNVMEETLAAGNFSLQSVIRSLAKKKQIRFYTINRSESICYQNLNTMKDWMRSTALPFNQVSD